MCRIAWRCRRNNYLEYYRFTAVCCAASKPVFSSDVGQVTFATVNRQTYRTPYPIHCELLLLLLNIESPHLRKSHNDLPGVDGGEPVGGSAETSKKTSMFNTLRDTRTRDFDS